MPKTQTFSLDGEKIHIVGDVEVNEDEDGLIITDGGEGWSDYEGGLDVDYEEDGGIRFETRYNSAKDLFGNDVTIDSLKGPWADEDFSPIDFDAFLS